MFKKIFITLLTVSILLPLIGSISSGNRTNADELYPMACPIFEVSDVHSDGTMSKVSCHDDFDSAKQAMKKDADYVVRMAASWSPMKIVAMNSGFAYSYPQRSGSKTMRFYYVPTFSDTNDTTYIGQKGIEMTYLDTYSINKDNNGMGKVKIIINGFEGYTDLEYVDLVPRKFVEKGIACYLGGNDNTNNNEQPYKVIPKQNYYILKQNDKYLDIEFHCYWNYPYSKEEPYAFSYKFGSGEQYRNIMSVNQKYYSYDGIRFYSDNKYQNYVGSVYSYYQFLPFRTKTAISASTLNKYVENKSGSLIKNKGQTFIDAQDKYGTNALMVFAMACHESAYGTSSLAVSNNNLFGWNALDSDPGAASTYSSVDDCISQHCGYNLRKYLDRSQGLWYGSCVGTKGVGFNVNYASDPYWGYSIASIAYDIDKSANNYNGKLTEYNNSKIGVITEYECVLYSGNSTNTNKYYKLRYRANHFNDYTVAVLGVSDVMTLTQSTNPIKGGTVIDLDIPTDEYKKKISYDWSSSTGYVLNRAITPINYSNGDFVVNEESNEIQLVNMNGVQYAIVDDVKLNNAILSIQGVSTITKYNYTKQDFMNQKVKAIDMSDSSKYYVFDANTIDSDGYSISDGYDYKYTGFSIDIDLSTLPNGSYYFTVLSNNGLQSLETLLRSSSSSLNLRSSVVGNTSYTLQTYDKMSYRFELQIENKNLDYSSINKPNNRSSYISFDDISINDEGVLNIEGQGMIYGLNYNGDDISHKLYLISDSQFISVPTETLTSDVNYQEYFNSKYNMDKISFKASQSILDLEPGKYKLVLEINNGNYKDYIEISNRFNDTLQSNIILNNHLYTFVNSNIRHRVELIVE